MQQSVDVVDKNASVRTTVPALKTLPSQNIKSTRPKSLTKKSECKASKTFPNFSSWQAYIHFNI